MPSPDLPAARPALDRFDPAPAQLALPAAGEIQVWRVPLDPPPGVEARLRPLLAGDERARADRFRFEVHRRRYTVGRAILRTLLGRYLSVSPESVRFRYGPNEKPYLDHPGATIQFNLSNSEDLAVVAFVDGEEVGADVEQVRPMPDAMAISERFFSASERRALADVEASRNEAERDRAFFRCWTRKEAYLKAVGTGITVPLDRFDVTLGAEDEPRVLAMEGDAARAAEWSLYHLEPGEGYLGALAIRHGPWRLRGWSWDD